MAVINNSSSSRHLQIRSFLFRAQESKGRPGYSYINYFYFPVCNFNPASLFFPLPAEEAPPPTPLTESLEDTYITQTSAPPNIVVDKDSGKILGLSVEGAVLYMLKAFEVRVPAVLVCCSTLSPRPSHASRPASGLIADVRPEAVSRRSHYLKVLRGARRARHGTRRGGRGCALLFRQKS